jgi:hypothetical protein
MPIPPPPEQFYEEPGDAIISAPSGNAYLRVKGELLKIQTGEASATGKPDYPTIPSEGRVEVGREGVTQTVICALHGDSSTKKWKISHGLKTKAVQVTIASSSESNPKRPYEIVWPGGEWPGKPTMTVKVVAITAEEIEITLSQNLFGFTYWVTITG